MKALLNSCVCIALCLCMNALPLQAQRLKVSDNKRFLVTADGKPFFWLGDTAWEIFHRLDKVESDHFLRNRAGKGFTVVQAVILSEINGVTTPNREGNLPLIDKDPNKPNEKYFSLVDYVVDRAAEYGIYMAMLPVWGAHVEDKFHPLFENIHIFTPANAEVYGHFLGNRYKDKWNVVWVLGGDRIPEEYMDIWNALAKGLKDGSQNRHLLTYHPWGHTSSSQWLHKAAWLDFNMIQVGHARTSNNDFEMVSHDYALSPVKPVLNAESTYEDHPVAFSESNPRYSDYEVRKSAYWSVFAGAFGHTYGNHNIWQMYRPGEYPSIAYVKTSWQQAMESPGSFQMRHLRNLIESRPFLSRIPDQSLLLPASPVEPAQGRDSDRIQVTRDGVTGKNDATYIMAYMPYAGNIRLNTKVIPANKLKVWWFDPRQGLAFPLGTFENKGEFSPEWNHRIREHQTGPDWVLVIDDATRNYPPPGQK